MNGVVCLPCIIEQNCICNDYNNTLANLQYLVLLTLEYFIVYVYWSINYKCY